MWLLITIVAVLFVVIMAVGIYNSLVSLRNRYKNAFAQIDVQLKRRYDLIPNLVEIAKKYMAHERETLEAVIKARNNALAASKAANNNPGDPKAMQALMGAEAALGKSMGGIFALAEAYPDIKADQTMMQLTEEITSTENKIAFARQAFNDAVMTYNIKTETFPSNIFARMYNFKEAALFEVTNPTEREPVKVSFA